ncbi:MAG: radical SAM protein [Parasphingorhabdus sp.]
MSKEVTIAAEERHQPSADDIIDLAISILSDGRDHPELWNEIPVFLLHFPDFPALLQQRRLLESNADTQVHISLVHCIALAESGQLDAAFDAIEDIAITHSQSALVQGALFHLHSLKDPENPKFQLAGKICNAPFQQMDVLEESTHLCCASWLQQSAGDLSTTDWQSVWNSDMAQDIRASIHDGSYRFCNKMACPKIQTNTLVPAEEMAKEAPLWDAILSDQLTAMPVGPEVVNLAYDRTCNLSCPSCRSEKYAADSETRARYEEMQRQRILPMLKDAKTVFVTGSGDPFASKNFRRLMSELTPEDYPELGFQIMTNGMLFTPKQWEAFPSLHGRVRMLKISVDAATGPTHELLRRGAYWPTMLENMRFAGDLTKDGMVDQFDLIFVVQQENFREMGDAIDLAKQVGATGVYFARITNWGTFSDTEFSKKAVCMPSHPDHGAFIDAMQDERLRDPMVMLGDLNEFLADPVTATRAFVG